MIKVSRFALGASLALGGAMLVTNAPAFAQKAKKAEASTERAYTLSKEERAALGNASKALKAKDYPTALAAIAAGQAIAKGADAKYLLAGMRLGIGIDTADKKMQMESIDAMIASGGAAPADLPALYRNQAAIAGSMGDTKKAESALSQLLQSNPNDVSALVDLAKLRTDQKKHAEAASLLVKAIDLKRAANQQVPDSWYRVGINLSMMAKAHPQALKLNRQYIAAYPNAENWRDALLNYREASDLDDDGLIDLMRLQRAAKAMAGERDYLTFAKVLDNKTLTAEAKGLLDDGVGLKMVDANKPEYKALIAGLGQKLAGDRAGLPALEKKASAAATGGIARNLGDIYLGYEEYAKAAQFFRTALQKGGVDANLVNTRLGIALALAGQRAEAEAAFKAVSAGPRAELAHYWLTWLAQKPA